MKKTVCILFAFFILLSCSKQVVKSPSTRTFPAVVIAQKGVLVGEFPEGSRVIEKSDKQDVLVWEGYQLLLRSEEGETYRYLSHDLYYEGDRLLITVQDGRVLKAKYRP